MKLNLCQTNVGGGANNYSPLPSGVYLYQLKVGGYPKTEKISFTQIITNRCVWCIVKDYKRIVSIPFLLMLILIIKDTYPQAGQLDLSFGLGIPIDEF